MRLKALPKSALQLCQTFVLLKKKILFVMYFICRVLEHLFQLYLGSDFAFTLLLEVLCISIPSFRSTPLKKANWRSSFMLSSFGI